MENLSDLYFFAKVVEHGGFAAAGRAISEPKSKLSRRVAQLEARLGIRLIERSTRRFRVTEIGQAFYERCRTILIMVEQAEALAAEAQGEPRGLVRMSCPTGLIEIVTRVIAAFMARYPRVRVQLVATDRRVVLIDERIDVALRVRTTLDSDAELSVRIVGKSQRILVAAPELASQVTGGDPAALGAVATLSSAEDATEVTWELVGRDDQTRTLRHTPRLACGQFGALRAAAAAGLGVAFIPDHACSDALAAGALVRVCPDWHGEDGIVHLVFTTRRGLPPSVRALIDHLAEGLRDGAFGAPAPSSRPATKRRRRRPAGVAR